MRNGWKKGQFIIVDSESGMTRYSGQVKKDYTGEMVTKRYADYEQPQDFIKPSDDPSPIPFSNPGLSDFTVDALLPDYVGNTSVLTPSGPANHLFLSTNRYWVGGTGSWNGDDLNKWAYHSGGAAIASEPTAENDVYFDAISGSVTVTISASTRSCLSLNFTGFTGTLAGSINLNISGSLTLSSAMTISYSGSKNFISTDIGKNITSNGKSLGGGQITFDGVGGEWTLIDALTTTNNIVITNGTLITNNNTVTAFGLTNSGTLTLGTSILNITGTGQFTINTSSTISAASSTINYTSSSNTFAGGGKTYNIVNITNGSSGIISITGVNTISQLTLINTVTGGRFNVNANQTVSGALTLSSALLATSFRFASGTTTTFGTLSAAGSSGKLVTISGVTAVNYNMIATGGGVTTDYLTISNNQFSGSTWHAGANSVDGGNNTGITFP